MRRQKFLTVLWGLVLAVPTAFAADPGQDLVRLRGHVLDVLANATAVEVKEERGTQPRPLTLTVLLKRDDDLGFDHYLQDVYDPQSKNFRRFLTPTQIADRFGPSRRDYAQVAAYLRGQGFHEIQAAKNRLTLTVKGTRAQVEHAFSLHIGDYAVGARRFFANDRDPGLPAALAPRIQSIAGLSNLAEPRPTVALIIGYLCFTNLFSNGFLTAPQLEKLQQICYKKITSINVLLSFLNGWKSLSDPSPGDWVTLDGTGQTIGLVEFDSFSPSDVSNYLALIGAPATQINNLSSVPVNGGTAPGANQDEVLLDIDTVMTAATGAKVVVYDAPFSGQAADYTALFNAMINGGVTIISNSWASCEDQVSAADAQSIDAVLRTAAASGISVFNGTGDAGSNCLDGSPNTVAVPADSPNATAVGGTSPVIAPGGTYGGETWWNGSNASPPTGQGGFGVSKYFSKPGYQGSLNAAAMRSVPDVVSPADPATGVVICEASAGGCPTGALYGGTSFAAPSWAAFAAILNEAHGSNLGAFNPLLYPLAGTAAFHSAASMMSDFAHVGLGSPNLNALDLALNAKTAGAPSAATSEVVLYLANGLPSTSAVPLGVPADGTTKGYVAVRLRDSGTNTVAGKTITLSASGGAATISPASAVTTGNNGAAVFSVSDLTAENITFTATDTTDGLTLTQTAAVSFAVPTAASGGITANPPTVPADGLSTATVTVTLKDALGRPTPGKTVTIGDGGAHAVLSGPTPGVTDANGQIQFSATDQVAETVTFTAVDVTDNDLAIPGSATVTYSGSTNTACGEGTVPVAGTGFTVTPYITGLPAAPTIFYGNANIGCPGANNPAFTPGGTVLVSDFDTGSIYQTGLAGGAVSSSNILNTLTPALGGLVYGKDGNVYATLGDEGAQIVQIDPTTGAQLRVVASGLTCPAGLAVDPLSGDLFFDDECTGAGTDNASIFRVIDPANSNPAEPTSVVVYATLPTTPNAALAFAPNGTLYAVSGYYVTPNAPIEQISGTNSATVSVSAVPGITSSYSLAVGAVNPDGSAQSLIVLSTAGVLSEVPIASPSTPTVLVAANAPGAGVVGPDGCLYSAGHDAIYKIANSSGGCTSAPTSPASSLALTPATVSPNPTQSAAETFTATLKNVTTPSGIPVFFQVIGANQQIKVATTDANGNAVVSYTGIQAGVDTVVASTTAAGTALTSNSVQVTWTAGKHVTFVGLNLSPQGGTVNQPFNASVSLTDVSAKPAASLAGQAVTVTLGSSTCTATTNSAGVATCTLTPSTAGTATLTATFAGSSALAPAQQSAGVNVSFAATPAPTVSLSVSPTTIAAGSPATLTWSSTNATACTAAGAWSGAEPTSGSLTVTPATNGSYSYTLTCTGNGGTATATAVLAATLATVTVTAHSGGGAMSGILLALLGLLVLLRVRAGRPAIGGTLLCLAIGLGALGGSGVVRADPTAAADVNSVLDQVYVGVRAGTMSINLSDTHLDAGLAAAGYGEVAASTHDSAFGGTLYLGYELAPHADLEFAYTHRDSRVATLSGTVASSASFAPLVQDTAGLIRGYGNIFAVSFRGRLEVAPRVFIDPRIGVFYWDTKVTAAAPGAIFDTNHSGGGLTLGIGAAYRVWRGLEIGAGVDYFDGSPNNSAVLYAGTLEWRFGKR